MKELTKIAAALSDEGRVRIVLALAGRELCVCQMVELLDLAPSTVSKHISILRGAGLIEPRKDGRWVFYRLADKKSAPREAIRALEWACDAARDSAQAKKDAAKLKNLLKTPPEELCTWVKQK
ncbi:MAG: winged helix-turn-helix transcriptional regulator [bacterium]|jgi:DNA-binding transcriptional ArsR family regulator